MSRQHLKWDKCKREQKCRRQRGDPPIGYFAVSGMNAKLWARKLPNRMDM
jgi:hypothetical protein